MLSRPVLGMLLMLLNGMLNAAMVVSARLLQKLAWPYFRLMGASSFLIVLCLTAGICGARAPLPKARQAKWLLLRGMFGAATFVLQISAVRIGTSPGDVAALASINTIMAALFGRLFLGEKLRWAQGISVVFCVSGATLISKPGFLFNSSDDGGLMKWLGFSLAAASGLTQAFVFISARKSSKASPLFLNISPAFFCVLAFGLMPLVPFVDDASLMPVANSPAVAVAIVTSFFMIQSLAITSNSAASTWCPAAVSATVNTGSKMLSGYTAQAFLFDRVPDSIAIGGAGLMLCAVVIMAVARRESSSPPLPVVIEKEKSGDGNGATDDADDTESIASFIATEFVEFMPDEKPIRLRHQSVHDPSAQPIGVAAAFGVAVVVS